MNKFLVWGAMLTMSAAAYAQTITVQGTVFDQTDGEPLIGATVTAMHKAGSGTATDLDGNFTITVPEGTTLKFSYVGYQTAELKAQPKMTVFLTSDDQILDDVVVVGYQTVRKADLTGAVSVMNMKQPLSENSGNIMNSMAGKLPGVNVVPDAAPGGTGTIRVRGMSTANSSNDPLYIIDGVPTDNLNCINPSDIESMQVLKDAASASIYGSRAANGVVIITTKHGKGDRLSVNVNYALSAAHTAKRYKMLDAMEYGQAYWTAARNSNVQPVHLIYGDGPVPVIQEFVAGNPNFPTTNTDWQDEIYQTAWTNNLTATVSNNTDKGSVLFSANYINQDGVVKQTYYERFSGRINSRFDINNYVSVGENLVVARWSDHGMGDAGGRGLPWSALATLPCLPIRGLDGDWMRPKELNINDLANPVQVLEYGKDNDNTSWRILGNAFLEVRPVLKGLTLKTNIGIEHSQYFNKGLGRSLNPSDQNYVDMAYGQGDTWTWTNTANYVNTFNDLHHLNVLFGTEAIGYTFKDLTGKRYGYPFENTDFMQLGAGTSTTVEAGGGKTQWSVFSIFGKVDYNFADRYLASFTIRHDSNSRFAKENRGGTFSAASVAWRPTAESFFPQNDVLTDMKIRYSWGQNGNANIPPLYPTYSTYVFNRGNGAYDLQGTGSSTQTGITIASTGNPELKWETTTQNNIGVDLQFFGGALNVTGDFYIKKTTDMLTVPPTLDVAGENAAMWMNTGDMKNTGWEVSVGYLSPRYGDFSWNGSINISQYKNKLEKISSGIESMGSDVRLMVGQPMGVIYGWVYDGIFQNMEEVANHAYQHGAAPGRMIFRDLDGNGVIDDNDRCIIGNPNPDLNMGINLGFTYKNVSLDMFLSGDFGFDIINDMQQQLRFMSSSFNNSNRGKEILNAWTPTNTNTDIPALSLTDDNNELRISNYNLQDGSYMKMKYIKLSYEFPSKLLSSWGCQGLNVYGQVENVFTLTKYKGLDPEIMPGAWGDRRDNGAYPRSRTFTLGVNLQF